LSLIHRHLYLPKDMNETKSLKVFCHVEHSWFILRTKKWTVHFRKVNSRKVNGSSVYCCSRLVTSNKWEKNLGACIWQWTILRWNKV
jgi:hypothetical protein